MNTEEAKKVEEDWTKSGAGTCPSTKMFVLGSHGTALVGCGHVADHDNGYHTAAYTYDDGSYVLFRWSVDEPGT